MSIAEDPRHGHPITAHSRSVEAKVRAASAAVSMSMPRLGSDTARVQIPACRWAAQR
jgi:hypothetical protein